MKTTNNPKLILQATFSLVAFVLIAAAPGVRATSPVEAEATSILPYAAEAVIDEVALEEAERLSRQPREIATEAPPVTRSFVPVRAGRVSPQGGTDVIVTATAGAMGPIGYGSLGSAINAINAGDHQGDITVSIQNSTSEAGTIVLNGSGAGDASYTSILIRPTANSVTVSGMSPQGRGLFELNGASNVTIDGDNPNSAGINRNLTFHNTAANTVTFTSVIRIALAASIVSNANNNTFRNLNIIGSSPGRNISTATSTAGTENTTFGILAGLGGSTSSASTPPTAITSVSTGIGAGASAANLDINNNAFSGSMARAVSINGIAASVFPNLHVRNNVIGNPVAAAADQVTAIGITVQGSANAIVSGNTVYVEGYVASSAAGHGINAGVNSASVANTTIENNKVSRVRNNHPSSWSAFGINLGGGSDHIVQNNFVFDVRSDQTTGLGGFSATFGAFGIRIGSGTGHRIYHNSVHLFGFVPGETSTLLTAAFLHSGTVQTGVDVRNNIFSNQLTGGNPAGTRHACVALPSGGTSGMNLTWNNNNYFQGPNATGPLSLLAQVGFVFGTGQYFAADFNPVSTAGAANFRSYTATLGGISNDNASKTANPQFVSDTDLHISVVSPMVDMGANVGVLKDIDGQVRVPPVDIGADEPAGTAPAANDIAAGVIVSPPEGAIRPANFPTPVQAEFINVGTVTQMNVPVRVRILNSSSVVVYDQAAVILSIAPDQTAVVSFLAATLSPGTYTMQAIAELPGDQGPANDISTSTFTMAPPLSGAVTVGAGGEYASLTNTDGVFDAINTRGLSGTVTINIISDLTSESGGIGLNQWTEHGFGGYSLVILPSGGARSIIGNTSGSAVIRFVGASRVTVDGSIGGLGTDRSLSIENTSTVTPSVILFGSVGTTPINNNTLKNCVIRNGVTTSSAVVVSDSGTLGNPGFFNNITIQNNSVQRAFIGIYASGGTVPQGGSNLQYIGNDLTSPGANAIRLVGLYVQGVNGILVSGNRVGNLSGGEAEVDRALWLATGTINATVDSNTFSGLNYTGTAGWSSQGIAVSTGQSSANIMLSNNMLSDIGGQGSSFTATTAGQNPFGIFVFGAQSGVRIYHNSINLFGNRLNQANALSAGIAIGSTATGGTSSGIELVNNIVVNDLGLQGATGYGAVAVWLQGSAAQLNFASNNNYLVNPSGGGVKAIGQIASSPSNTVPDWQAATGREAGTISVDPLFVSPTDLHITCSSPMVNAGNPAGGIPTDFDGQMRDSLPDIGADELVAPTALSAVSRLTHGGAGTFDVPLPGIEPRSTGGNYQVVFTFASPVAISSAAVTSGTGMVSGVGGNGSNSIAVNLSGVANAQFVTVTLLCANDGLNSGNVSVTMGVLVGDTNASGAVNATDISQTKSQSGLPLTNANFHTDINVSGSVTAADISLVKSLSNSMLP